MNEFRTGRGNAGRCSFSPLRTGWEGWMFRHFPGPIIDSSPSVNNHQASTGIELWALLCLGQEAGWVALTSLIPHLLDGNKELAQDHTHPWWQSKGSCLAYSHIQVNGRASTTYVSCGGAHTSDSCWPCLQSWKSVGRKHYNCPHAALDVRSGHPVSWSLSEHPWQIQNQKSYAKHANPFTASFVHINAHVLQEIF